MPGSALAAPPGTSIVATASGKVVTVYRAPRSGTAVFRLQGTTPNRTPAVFLVKRRRIGWEQVYLPFRPNDRTGWIRDAQVSLTADSYRVGVSLSAHRLTVWKNGRVIDRERAGVGKPSTPTPTGRFYLVELLAQANPHGIYGPYAFGLSAFSDVLSSFGGGPGQIGLHGTDDPEGLGTSVSHGCVRIGNAAIAKLARLLPLGTPVVISN